MSTFVLALVIVGFLILAMSIGVIMGRSPIKGTCGGIGALGVDGACEICGGDTRKCEEETRRDDSAKKGEALGYDATKK